MSRNKAFEGYVKSQVMKCLVVRGATKPILEQFASRLGADRATEMSTLRSNIVKGIFTVPPDHPAARPASAAASSSADADA